MSLSLLPACNNKEKEKDSDSEYFQMEEDPAAKAAILGKWTKIANGEDEEHMKWFEPKPGSYSKEFLENGEVKNPFTSEYTTKYIIGEKNLIMYIHKQEGGFHVYEYSLINVDTLKIKHVYGPMSDIMGNPYIFIYKRFKD
jgi:hypothetical protein